LALFVAGIGLGALAGWRLFFAGAVVEVRFSSQTNNLPLEVEVIPPEIRAGPGEMVRVVYRIRNHGAEPLTVYGTVKLQPGEAGRQVEFYVIECGGLQTFESGTVRDYQVMFQVRPQNTWVTPAFTVQHVFALASAVEQ
jgi:cytochrome c oxidase assembly protein Cox11